MNLHKLFEMQKALDTFIETTLKIEGDVFKEKGLALMVELAELANETRCFKFWSTKGPSERSIMLEEYVDSIHFLLSLGLMKGFTSIKEWPVIEEKHKLTDVFLMAQEVILTFIPNPTEDHYREIWRCYSLIAYNLGFSFEEIVHAYLEKNEENYKR